MIIDIFNFIFIFLFYCIPTGGFIGLVVIFVAFEHFVEDWKGGRTPYLELFLNLFATLCIAAFFLILPISMTFDTIEKNSPSIQSR